MTALPSWVGSAVAARFSKSAGVFPLGPAGEPERMAGMKKLTDMSGPEIYTAYAVGIGTVFLFIHYDLIPKGYMSGRMTARVAFVLGFGAVLLAWPLIFKKKN